MGSDGKLPLKIPLLVVSSEGMTGLQVQDGLFTHIFHAWVDVTSMLEPDWAFLSLHAASLCGQFGLPHSDRRCKVHAGVMQCDLCHILLIKSKS